MYANSIVSIYAAEYYQHSRRDHHAYVVLAEEEIDGFPQAIEEIHYTFTEDDKVIAQLKTGDACSNINHSDIFLRVRSEAAHVMPIWNGIIKSALATNRTEPRIAFYIHGRNFDAHCAAYDTHCRAGVQTGFELTGLPKLVGGGEYAPFTPKSLLRSMEAIEIELDFEKSFEATSKEHESLVVQIT